ncbi:MAG: hypothetical protein Q4C96_03850 [Planctomycetia bacterium]|nr:hypothetical protein [Planctomycetia bacterium]
MTACLFFRFFHVKFILILILYGSIPLWAVGEDIRPRLNSSQATPGLSSERFSLLVQDVTVKKSPVNLTQKGSSPQNRESAEGKIVLVQHSESISASRQNISSEVSDAQSLESTFPTLDTHDISPETVLGSEEKLLSEKKSKKEESEGIWDLPLSPPQNNLENFEKEVSEEEAQNTEEAGNFISKQKPAETENRNSSGSTQNSEEASFSTIPVETAGFNGVIPGKTSLQEAEKILGKAIRHIKNGAGEGMDAYEFQVEGFQHIVVHTFDETIYAIITDLLESVPARQLATELNLDMIQSVFLSDDNGQIMGEIFPEIGVSFAYNPKGKLYNVSEILENNLDTAQLKTEVTQILFQPVAPEPFLFRAESWRADNPQRSLADVEEALKIQPDHTEALTIKKELLAEIAQHKIITEEIHTAQVKTPTAEITTETSPGSLSDETQLPILTDETPEERAAETSLAQTEVELLPDLPENLPIIDENRTHKTKNAMISPPASADSEILDLASSISEPQQEEFLPALENSPEISGTSESFKEARISSETSASHLLPNKKFLEIETLARKGLHEQALQENRKLRQLFSKNPSVEACSLTLEADILMIMPSPNYQNAMNCYTKAIRQGTALLHSPESEGQITSAEKRMLGKMLIDAYQGIAASIAQGKWGNKEHALKLWTEKARQHSADFIKNEYASDISEAAKLAYRVAVRNVAIYTRAGSSTNLHEYVSDMLESTQKLLALNPDKETQHLICFETALTLDEVARIYILTKEYQDSARFLKQAITFMESVSSSEQTLTNDRFLLGNLYYRMGFIYSLQAEHLAERRLPDQTRSREIAYHKSAVYYYEKSIPHLMFTIQQKKFEDILALGEMTASMSISYWETGNYTRSEDLLKAGILCLERHISNHPDDKNRLVVHYENLCQMLTYLKKPQEAEKYTQKLQSLMQPS